MSERTYYVICADNCRFEGLTKEQIYDAIAEATGSTPTSVDDAFITMIKEQNAQASLKVWKGTEAQYNALATKQANTLYFIGTNAIKDVGALEEDIEDFETELENWQKTKVCTLSSSGWTASGDYYVQTVSSLTIHDEHPTWIPCNSTGESIPSSYDSMFLAYAVTGTNSITFYAYNQPSADIYVLVKGVE